MKTRQPIWTPEQIAERIRLRDAGEPLPLPAPVDMTPPRPPQRREIGRLMARVERVAEDSQREIRLLRGQLDRTSRKTPEELRHALNMMFETINFSPAEELARMCMETDSEGRFALGTSERIRILSELNSYVMPKLKSVEVSGKVDHQHTIEIHRFGADGSVRTEKVVDAKDRPLIEMGGPVERVIEGGVEAKAPVMAEGPRKIKPRVTTALKEQGGVFREVEIK